MWRLQTKLRELYQFLVGSVYEFRQEWYMMSEIWLLEEALRIVERAMQGEQVPLRDALRVRDAWRLVGGAEGWLQFLLGEAGGERRQLRNHHA